MPLINLKLENKKISCFKNFQVMRIIFNYDEENCLDERE